MANQQLSKKVEELEQQLAKTQWLHVKENVTTEEPYFPFYGDITELNTQRTILDTVGKETLEDLTSELMDLLDTSVAIYEKNGDYAYGKFNSGWCQLLDAASRKLCNTDNNKVALNCGKWLCHDVCWNDSAKAAIQLKKSTDVECAGALRLFAEPIFVGDKVIGVINIGYGNPPTDEKTLLELAKKYKVDFEILKQKELGYNPRPDFIINIAKKRLKSIAKLIGEIVSRKQAEYSLSINEQRLNEAQHIAKIGNWEMNVNTGKAYMSDQLYRLFGYKPGEVKASDQLFRKHIHPDDLHLFDESITAFLAARKQINVIFRYITKDGEVRTAHSIGQIELDKNRKPIKAWGTLQDVTKIKEAEQELKVSEGKLNLIINESPFPVVVVDINNEKIIYWSKSIQKLTGYSPKTVAEWYNLAYPDPVYQKQVIEQWKPMLKKAVESDNAVNTGEYQITCKDGSVKTCELFAQIIPGNLVVTFNDVTHIKEAEQEILKAKDRAESNEDKFLKLFNSVSSAIFIYHPQTFEIIEANETTSKLYGYSLNELVGMSCLKLSAEADESKTVNKIAYENGKHYVNFRHHKKKDGTSVFVQLFNHKLPMDDQEYMFAVCDDITEKIKSEHALKQNSKRQQILLELNEMTDVEINEIYDFALKNAIEITESKIGFLGFVNADESMVKIHAWSSSVMSDCEVQKMSMDFDMEKAGIWGEAIRQRKPFLINDFKADNPLKRGVPQGHVEINNYLSIPVFDGNKIVAIVSVGNKSTDYNKIDIQELTLLAKGMWNIVERKLNAQKTIAAEKKLKETFNLSPAIIAKANLTEGLFVEANKAVTRILGYSIEEFTSIPIMELIHPDDKQKTIDVINSQLKGSEVSFFENRYLCKGGLYKWIAWHGAQADKNGIVTAIGTDISVRKKAELRIEKSSKEFQTWIQNTPVCTKKIDLDFNLQYMSKAGIKELKVGDVNELYGAPYPFNFFPEPFKKTMAAKMKEVKETGEIKQIDGILSDTQGNQMWYNHILVPVKNNKGKAEYLLIISNDISERKQAEEKLKSKNEELRQANEELIAAKLVAEENETKFKSIFENLVYEVHLWEVIRSKSGKIKTWKLIDTNPSALKAWKKTKEQVIGKTADEIFNYDVTSEFRTIVEEIFKTKKPLRWEKFFKPTNQYLSMDSIPFGNYFISTGRDISHEKQMELRLKANNEELIAAIEKAETSEEQHRFLFENMIQGVVYHDLSGEIIYANMAAARILGITLDQLNGKTSMDPRWKTIHEDGSDYPGNTHPVAITLKTKKPVRNAKMGIYIPAEDRYNWININSIPRFNKKTGKLHQVVVTFEDITEMENISLDLIKAKEKAEESEFKVRGMFKNTEMGIIFCNAEGQILEINKAIISILGSPSIEATKQLNLLAFKPLVDVGFSEKLQQSINERTTISGEMKYKSKWGAMVFMRYQLIPLVVRDKLIGVWINLNNLTNLWNSKQELIKAKEKAEESNRLKTAFLQNISHEIRTPLNAICGFSSRLGKPTLSEEKRKGFVSIIQTSSNQLLSILTDILTVSALETKQEKINTEKVCINTVIVDLLTIFKQQSINQNISLYSKQPLNDKQAEIYTDKTKITQILSNLIANAVKFTHQGSIEFGYRLKTENEQNEMEFYVKDNGVGINPELQEKIFERFRQADLTTKRKYGGTGLGLSICKGFTELLGGKIWVKSEIGKGSTFYFTIPYKPVNDFEEIEKQNMTNNKPIILIAEDEEFNYLYLEELLIDLNYKLIHAKDGQEAVKMVNSDPDILLILMDIKMPVMDGHTAAKIIKEQKPNLPIIAQSAYALESEIEKYGDIFDDYLTKPINEELLIEKVNKYIKDKKKD